MCGARLASRTLLRVAACGSGSRSSRNGRSGRSGTACEVEDSRCLMMASHPAPHWPSRSIRRPMHATHVASTRSDFCLKTNCAIWVGPKAGLRTPVWRAMIAAIAASRRCCGVRAATSPSAAADSATAAPPPPPSVWPATHKGDDDLVKVLVPLEATPPPLPSLPNPSKPLHFFHVHVSTQVHVCAGQLGTSGWRVSIRWTCEIAPWPAAGCARCARRLIGTP